MRPQKRARSRRAGILSLLLLLALASPAGAAEPLTDPVGDTVSGPDIEQIVITPADTVITMQIIVTTLWQPGWSMQILISTDPRLCSSSTSPYTVAQPASLIGGTSSGAALLTADGAGGWSGETPLDHQIDGTAVMITLPRASIGDPEVLNFWVATFGDPSPYLHVTPDQDHSPDGDGCHSVDVDHAVPDTATQSAAPVWPATLFGLFCLLLAVELRRRDGGC